MQSTVVKGLRQRVVRQGKMVHPYFFVAKLQKTFFAELIQISLVLVAREIFLIVAPLSRALDPRNVRITVERNPVRTKLGSHVDGLCHCIHALMRKPKDKIVAD